MELRKGVKETTRGIGIMLYHFKVHKEGDGFWAECIEIPGCVTQGYTKKELFENMKEAINTYLEEPKDSKYVASLPKKNIQCSRSIVKVPVDPEVAFGFMLRYHRIKSGLTQKEAAKCLGMRNLFSYQHLERRCNATLEVIAKLMNLFPTFPLDKIFR